MFTFKFSEVSEPKTLTEHTFGSLPVKPEPGHIVQWNDDSLRFVILRVDGEGLEGPNYDKNQQLLAWDDISGGKVPTLWLQRITDKVYGARGRSFSAEEMKEYSQVNRETRLSASAG